MDNNIQIKKAEDMLFGGLNMLKEMNLSDNELIELKLEMVIKPMLNDILKLAKNGDTEYIRSENTQKAWLIAKFILKDSKLMESQEKIYSGDITENIYIKNILDMLAHSSIIIKISYHEFIKYVQTNYEISEEINNFLTTKDPSAKMMYNGQGFFNKKR